MRNNFKVTER